MREWRRGISNAEIVNINVMETNFQHCVFDFSILSHVVCTRCYEMLDLYSVRHVNW